MDLDWYSRPLHGWSLDLGLQAVEFRLCFKDCVRGDGVL